MAAKRVAKSAVDWVAFAERVPAGQKDFFRAFKARSDQFLSRVYRHPENLPQIDFGFYRSRIATAGMVDAFEKAYQGMNIPYPADKANLKGAIDADIKATEATTAAFVKTAQSQVADAQAMIDKVDSIPPLEEMTIEMYADFFPEKARNPWERPTFWPHTKSYQPENDPHVFK